MGQRSQSYIVDRIDPVIAIDAPTKLDNAPISDTTILITDDVGIDVSDVSISTSSTLNFSAVSCVQTSNLRVDCTIQIDDSGDLVVSADDVAGNNTIQSELDYIIDTTPPVLTLITPSPETVEYLSAYADG